MASQVVASILIDSSDTRPPSKPEHLPPQVGLIPLPHEHRLHPTNPGGENATLTFIGHATTMIEWRGLRFMTDPNFLHLGDQVHLAPAVTAERRTHPTYPFNQLPPIHLILLSHYHEDHFDKLVEDRIRRDIPIITTPHAARRLTTAQYKGDPFTAVTALDDWQAVDVSAQEAKSRLRVTATPGQHVPGGVPQAVNKTLKAIPPTSGWIVEMFDDHRDRPYTIYITGDTLMVDKLKAIPEKFPHVDLMLIHLGGTTMPYPAMPMVMTTMDAAQGIELVRLINADVTIPVHFDDYDILDSPLKDFHNLVVKAGLIDKVVYLGRGDRYSFKV